MAHNPSAWSHRRWILGLCLGGAAIASYLTAVQLHWVAAAWDPVFGRGSERVLFSSLSRALPFPDSSAGLLAYAVEAAFTLIGGESRWRGRPHVVLASAAIMTAAGLASVALVGVQLFVVRAACFLCLLSAAISVGVCLLAAPEGLLAWRQERDSK